jgi:poly(3-hydroxybutyrate) depolymerase
MLYHLHELHYAALTPVRLAAKGLQDLFTNPWVPLSYTELGRHIAAGCEVLERTTRRYPKPEFGLNLTTIKGRSVAVEEEVVLENPFCQLRHFKRDVKQSDPKVLLVAPMSGHHATLLRGTVKSLLPDHEVYITDWVDARQIPLSAGSFDLDDHIHMVIDFLHFLGPNTHVIAVCQPSPSVLAAVSLMAADQDPCQPASMTLMGGPVDTRESPTKVNELAATRKLQWFADQLIHAVPAHYAGAGRQVYPGFIQLSGFMGMNLDRHLDAHVKLFHHLVQDDGDSVEQHRSFYDEYLAVMDLPAEFYLQTIRTIFQEHALPNGTMKSRGRKVDPGAIKNTALLTVEGEKDDITGAGQCEAAHRLCTSLPLSKRQHHLARKVGHYGVFNGRRWREEILPHVRAFIRRHDRAVLAA